MAEERAQMNNQEYSNLNKYYNIIISQLSLIINIIMIYLIKYIDGINNIVTICFCFFEFYECNMILYEIIFTIKTIISSMYIIIKSLKIFLRSYHLEIFLDMLRIIVKEKNNNNVEFTQAIRKFGSIFQ